MNSLTYRKIVNGLTVFAVIVAILIPDVVLELIAEPLHLLLETIVEVGDIAFEWVESSLDHVIEHLFETDLHTTQIIVFYIIMSFIGYLFYRLVLQLPRFFNYLLDKLVVMFEVNKGRAYLYWYSLTMTNRIKLIAAFIVVIFGYVFLGM